jgi:hypothetical protein
MSELKRMQVVINSSNHIEVGSSSAKHVGNVVISGLAPEPYQALTLRRLSNNDANSTQ